MWEGWTPEDEKAAAPVQEEVRNSDCIFISVSVFDPLAKGNFAYLIVCILFFLCPSSILIVVALQEEDSPAPGSRRDLVKVQVTELVDAGCFFVQVLSPEKDQLDQLMHRLESLNLDAAPRTLYMPLTFIYFFSPSLHVIVRYIDCC